LLIWAACGKEKNWPNRKRERDRDADRERRGVGGRLGRRVELGPCFFQ